VLAGLREKLPEQEFDFHENKIKGKDRVIYLGNVYREVRSAPKSREEIIKNFVEKVSQPPATEYGTELWDDARGRIVPVLKPKDYIDPNSPTQHLLTREWLADVLVCYANHEPEDVSLRDRVGRGPLGDNGAGGGRTRESQTRPAAVADAADGRADEGRGPHHRGGHRRQPGVEPAAAPGPISDVLLPPAGQPVLGRHPLP